MAQRDEKNPRAFDVFSRFTQLRQTGANRDDAWYQVCDAVPDMSDVTRNAFLALAKDWERREGQKYRYRENSNHATLSTKDVTAAADAVKSPPQSQPCGIERV